MTTQPVIAEVRVMRTIDGRFVHDGDPDGAFLAYPQGAEIPSGDQAKYRLMMDDLHGSSSVVVAAQTGDDDARDLLRRRVAGDPSARTPLNEPPVLLSSDMHTELADEARAMANAPADEQQAIVDERADAAADQGKTIARWPIYRTAEGDLVHEGDESAAVLAYPVGAVVADDDVDEYNDLGAPVGADDDAEPDGATKPPTGAKRAAKSTNKAAAKPADK